MEDGRGPRLGPPPYVGVHCWLAHLQRLVLLYLYLYFSHESTRRRDIASESSSKPGGGGEGPRLVLCLPCVLLTSPFIISHSESSETKVYTQVTNAVSAPS